MPFETATAKDYKDLLKKLRTFAKKTLKWSELRWVSQTKELWLQGPGASADQPVNIGILAKENVAEAAYGWELTGAVQFDSSQAFDQQSNQCAGVWFNTWQNEITYWFYGNTRRIIIVAKCGTSYVSCYLGFFMPYALPEEYQFPFYIGGNYGVLAAYNRDNAGNRCIADPGKDSAWYYQRATPVWESVQNHNYKPSSSDNPAITNAVIWPTRIGMAKYTRSEDWSYKLIQDFRPAMENQFPLWQCQILDGKTKQFTGALDGVFYTPGFDRSSEQEITGPNNRKFRIFQNIFRTSNRDYFAIEEI